MKDTSLFIEEDVNNTLSIIKNSIPPGILSGNDTSFDAQLYKHLNGLLQQILKNTFFFDANAQCSISTFKEDFVGLLKSFPADVALENDKVGSLFSFLVIFHKEVALTTGIERYLEIDNILDFAIDNIKSFNVFSQSRINYATRHLPSAIFKYVLKSEEIEDLKKISQITNDAKKITEEWSQTLNEKENSAKKLEAYLNKIKDGFNFVGLNQGFSDLLIKKENEKKMHLRLMCLIATAIITPLIFKIYQLIAKYDIASSFTYIMKSTNTSMDITNSTFLLISTLSYIGVMLYFFRVVLFNYKSICAQISQIELRMTLCRFIQHYSEHAKEIKKNSDVTLDKFENIIFANLTNNDTPLPSTLDGIEQIVSIIKTAKGN